MEKEQFLELVENRHKYRIIKKLPGKLNYASIGDTYFSETLYENEYNMNKLVEQKYIEIVDEPFEFQKQMVGKNIHSVFVKCPECENLGINEPLNIECGNCGYLKCITY